MTWSLQDKAIDPWIDDARIFPKLVLYSYDGPTIFTAAFGFFEAIFLKVEEFDYSDLFLVSVTSNEVIDAIRHGFLSVRGAFATQQYWIVEARKDLHVRRYWACNKDELPEDFLPERNLTLFAHLGKAPDTLAESQSFFSLAFEGSKLKKAGMPFSNFKGLVDATHDAARKLLTPAYLVNRRTKTFDYYLQEPSFSSLVLAIKRPIINEEAIKGKVPQDYSIAGSNSVQEHFREQRDMFLEEMDEVVREASGGDVSDDLVQERYFLIEAIQSIIPTNENDLDYVGFTGGGDVSVKTVEMGAPAGETIRKAYKRADGISREIAGKIEIINSASYYFVLVTEGMRQINCSVEFATFKRLEKRSEFRNGSFVWVRGALYKRPRRDWLRVEGEPRLQAGSSELL